MVVAWWLVYGGIVLWAVASSYTACYCYARTTSYHRPAAAKRAADSAQPAARAAQRASSGGAGAGCGGGEGGRTSTKGSAPPAKENRPPERYSRSGCFFLADHFEIIFFLARTRKSRNFQLSNSGKRFTK